MASTCPSKLGGGEHNRMTTNIQTFTFFSIVSKQDPEQRCAKKRVLQRRGVTAARLYTSQEYTREGLNSERRRENNYMENIDVPVSARAKQVSTILLDRASDTVWQLYTVPNTGKHLNVWRSYGFQIQQELQKRCSLGGMYSCPVLLF